MGELRIRLKLYKGRDGVPIERLAKVVEEAVAFFEKFGADIGLGEGVWVAEKFRNQSLSYDIAYKGEATEQELARGRSALVSLADPKATPESVEDIGLRRATYYSFVSLAKPLDPDDKLDVGVYTTDRMPRLQSLTKARFLEVERTASAPVTYFGGFRGQITALFRAGNVFWLRDLLTNEKLSCKFPPEYYGKVWRLMEESDAIVNVEGWVTKVRGEIDRVDVTIIDPVPEYREGDLDRFFGADPDFTGGLATGEYLDKMRGEGDEPVKRNADE